MAIGFTVPNIPTRKVLPDKRLNRRSEPRVRIAQFGEGYQQRAIDGINNIVDSYALTFTNRDKTEADDILAFFDTKAAVTAFDFTIPDTNSTTTATGTVNGATDSTKAVVLDDVITNLEISSDATVTGSGISGTVKVSGLSGGTSGTALTLDTAQTIADNVTLTFTNPNEKTIKVVCEKWRVAYSNKDYYTVSAEFKRVLNHE
jgi:Phage-related protein